METKTRTELGTPCAASWDAEWIEVVEGTERKRRHRICGARLITGDPCSIRSEHPSGRCRFHGGFDMTGGQPGNRNALIHGLYSRVLRPCGKHCPQWKSCPFAGNDVEALPGAQRPTCPYEKEQFDHEVAELSTMAGVPDPDGDASDGSEAVGVALDAPVVGEHLLRHCALTAVMMSRALAALREESLCDVTNISKHGYATHSVKPSAKLQAYLYLSREYRRYRKLLEERVASVAPRRQGATGAAKRTRSADVVSPRHDAASRTGQHEHASDPASGAGRAPDRVAPKPERNEPSTTPGPADGRNPDPAGRARLLLEHADRFVEEFKSYQTAIDHFNEVIALDPALALAHYDRFHAVSQRYLADKPKAKLILPRPNAPDAAEDCVSINDEAW